VIPLDNSNKKSKNNQEHVDKKKGYDPSIHVSSKGEEPFKINKSVKKSSAEIDALNIPDIPEPPKRKSKLTLSSPGLSAQILKEVKDLENDNIKVVLVNCDRCEEVIAVPIPRNFVTDSMIPVVPVTYVHKNPKSKDTHCITLYLDSDFDIRRQRISDVVISNKIVKKSSI
jgi:hypothetical protein